MVRKAKEEAQEVVSEEVQETAQETVQTEEVQETVAMVRSEDYPEPRTADVNAAEVEEWSKHGWVKAE